MNRVIRSVFAAQFAVWAAICLPSLATAAPEFSITEPATSAVVDGAGQMNVFAAVTNDTTANISSVSLSVDGGEPRNMIKLWGSRWASVDEATLSEGDHVLTVSATDTVGDVTTLKRTVRVDRTAPVITFSAPTAGQVIAGTKQVVARVSDTNWIDNASLAIDGREVSAKMPLYFSVNYLHVDTTRYANGAHTFTVTSKDKAGNVGTATVTATVINDTAYTQAPPHTQWIEAENSLYTEPFKRFYGFSSSNNAYLDLAPTIGVNPTPTGAAGRASFTVSIPNTSWYRIMARTRAPSAGKQTMYVSIDGAAQIKWPIRLSNTFEWDEVNQLGKTADPAAFLLSAGTHTIALSWGDPGIKLDTLVISNDKSYSPAVADRFTNLGQAWTADNVPFALYTNATHQYVGYYDANRYLNVAMRSLSSRTWTTKNTGYQWQGYDSHRYIALGVDSTGRLHVAADMHASALVYFRATDAGSVTTLARVSCMICTSTTADTKMTYPEFYNDPSGNLLYKYRTGYPQDADTWLNVYDTVTRTWSRLTTEPWLSHPADSPMGAYPNTPVKGPDGLYHVIWVYRTDKGAINNRSLSYARSTNLRDWTSSSGAPLALPLTIENAEIIDPSLEGSGLVNGKFALGFAPDGSPLISYHRYNGSTSAIWLANLKDGAWQTRPVFTFSCANLGIEVRAPKVEIDGFISQEYESCGQQGRARINPTTMNVSGSYPVKPGLTGDLLATEPLSPLTICGYTGAAARTEWGIGPNVDAGKWLLRWYTLPGYGHFEQRPNCAAPEPVALRLYKLR